jgi:hypothetical protein
MKSEWPERRMQADLPFMAHMPYCYDGISFKTGNKQNDFAAAALKGLRPGSRAALSTRTWLRTAGRCCARPSENRVKVPRPPAECRQQRLQSSPTATTLPVRRCGISERERSHRP